MSQRAKGEGGDGGEEHGQASPDRLLTGPGWVPQPGLSQLAPDQGTKRVGEEDGLDDLQGQLVVEEDHDENEVDRDANVSCACVPELELYSHLEFKSNIGACINGKDSSVCNAIDDDVFESF